MGMVLHDTRLLGDVGTTRDGTTLPMPGRLLPPTRFLRRRRATYVDRVLKSLPKGLRHRAGRQGRQRMRGGQAAADDRAGVLRDSERPSTIPDSNLILVRESGEIATRGIRTSLPGAGAYAR